MDWNIPTLANTFSEVLSGLRSRDDESATLFKDGASASNLPSGAVRFNRATQVLETWDGNSWQPLPLSPAAIGGLNVGSRLATQAQAQTASDADALMSPLRVKDQIDARLASSAEAQAGFDQAKLMTPARTKEIFATNVASDAEVASGSAGAKFVTAGALKTHLDSRIGSAGGSVSFRNLLVNGEFIVNQINAAAASDCVDCIDGWYALTPSGSLGVSQQRAQEPGQTCNLRLTQPDASAKRFGLAQIVRNSSCAFARSSGVRMKARVRSSAAGKVNLAILSWSGESDTVTTNPIKDWSSVNYTVGNFFAATGFKIVTTGSVSLAANAWADIDTDTGTVPADMNNLIVVFWTAAPLASNATLDVGLCQLEQGAASSPFEHRPFAVEKLMIASSARTKTMLFNTPGVYAWASPFGVNKINLSMCGGGGGGAGGCVYNNSWATTLWGGFGGLGGRYCNQAFAITPCSTYLITVGDGGSAGANSASAAPGSAGSAGQASSFGTLITCTGGGAGINPSPPNPGTSGASGTPSTDSLYIPEGITNPGQGGEGGTPAGSTTFMGTTNYPDSPPKAGAKGFVYFTYSY